MCCCLLNDIVDRKQVFTFINVCLIKFRYKQIKNSSKTTDYLNNFIVFFLLLFQWPLPPPTLPLTHTHIYTSHFHEAVTGCIMKISLFIVHTMTGGDHNMAPRLDWAIACQHPLPHTQASPPVHPQCSSQGPLSFGDIWGHPTILVSSGLCRRLCNRPSFSYDLSSAVDPGLATWTEDSHFSVHRGSYGSISIFVSCHLAQETQRL